MYGNNYFNQPRYQTNGNQMAQPTYMQPSYIPPIPQPTSQISLLGKVVDSIDVVKAMDIPLDGSVSYFPLTDGSAIVTKQLQNNGTSKTLIYKPVIEENVDFKEYMTRKEFDETFGDFEKDIRQELKDIKSKIKAKDGKNE